MNAHVVLGEDGPLVTRLQQAGVSVEVLPIDAAARELRKDTVRFGGAARGREEGTRGTTQMGGAALGTAAYVARLALRLRALRPDLVHTNSLKAGVYGSLAARAAGVPVVWHVRDRIAEDYLPRPAVRLVRTLVRHLPDGVLANSEATLDTLGAARGAPRWVVPDSVELPRTSGAPPHPAPPTREAPPRPARHTPRPHRARHHVRDRRTAGPVEGAGPLPARLRRRLP